MTGLDIPDLNLAIAPLRSAGAGHWAVWVVQAPYPGGYVHHDRLWPEHLERLWQGWQAMFSSVGTTVSDLSEITLPEGNGSYSVRLMQHFGVCLWQWLMDGSIQSSLSQSQGIAMGQEKPLRLRLEIRDPELSCLPWEVMQPQAGRQVISVSQNLLFSRTTSDVDPLMPPRRSSALRILLVLGQSGQDDLPALQLQKEATLLAERLQPKPIHPPSSLGSSWTAACQVETLVQPSVAQLVTELEQGYSVLFYAGHGIPAPDGGQLMLGPNEQMSGTELAQVLTRSQVALAVFNACWGAQAYTEREAGSQQLRAVPRSSLAEVLIHHGVPAVLGMRDSIADEEALTFVESFAQALAEGQAVDQAVAVARQQLLTLYKFNQPAWTLPVLYMHPEFDGVLLQPFHSNTELPTVAPMTRWHGSRLPLAQVRSLQDPLKIWTLRGGLMRVGRRPENDVVVQEQWVSQQHAEIICRIGDSAQGPTYFLRDFSRFGTLIYRETDWHMLHQQEVALQSGTQIRFGSTQGQTFEFLIQTFEEDTHY